MGFQLQDGGGSGRLAKVNAENELVVRAITENELEAASEKGESYSWHAAAADIDTTDTMLFIKNLSDTALHLERLILGGSNVICDWTVGIGAASTTPTGTLITPVNLNESFASKVPDAIAYSDETAVATAATLDAYWTPITNTMKFSLSGIILGKNHYVQVTQITAGTGGSASIFGHYEL